MQHFLHMGGYARYVWPSYALALLANVSPADKTHANQKQAVSLLEPLDRAYPNHPGIPHYLIHACDNGELAPKGLQPARAYSKIAPSAPHALHMPSHIFTRLGLWDDSIASNLAAQDAAHQQGDSGEELHAMDYLVYAYLQSGRDQDAAQIIEQLKDMTKLTPGDFKVGYASTVMPIRYAVERSQWADAARIIPPTAAPDHVVAIAVWAVGMGLARGGHAAEARPEIDRLRQLEELVGLAQTYCLIRYPNQGRYLLFGPDSQSRRIRCFRSGNRPYFCENSGLRLAGGLLKL